MYPRPVHPEDPNPNVRFLEEVSAATAGVARLEMCIQCGTCGGSCPPAEDMDHTPRALFALIRAGYREEALRSNTPWICVSCYHCVVRCPQEVHITDVMYTLKGMAVKAKLFKDSTAPDFSKTFVEMVEKYGRSNELGLTTKHIIKHQHQISRLPGTAMMGLGMLTRQRISLRPKEKIKGIDQLTAILNKAREIEATV